MELVRVSAGSGNMSDEVAKVLPAAVPAPVRDLVVRMTGQLTET